MIVNSLERLCVMKLASPCVCVCDGAHGGLERPCICDEARVCECVCDEVKLPSLLCTESLVNTVSCWDEALPVFLQTFE